MDVAIERRGATLEVVVVGELDASNSGAFRDAVGEHLDESVSLVEVRANELRFVDSSGISEMVEIHQRVDGNGGRLTVNEPTPAVRRILEITGLSEAFGLA